MLILKIWCLPADEPQKNLKELFDAIVEEAKTHPDLHVQSERDMLCLFPADRMTYGLGTEILVEINGWASEWALAGFGKVVSSRFPTARVICRTVSVSQHPSENWDSKKNA